ncbi:MAG: maleylpyruvate isomerase family mycothiol-dependent enzyme [Dehalococcoidia bacterium]
MLSVLERFKLVNSEAKALKEYLDGLPLEALNKPSACDRWQGGDVLAHLVWVGELYAEVMNRASQGITDLPEDAPQVRYNNPALSSEDYIDQKAKEYRQRFGDQLIATFGTYYDNLYRIMMRMSLEEREKPCHYPSGVRPVWSMADMSVQELAIHHWDIRSRLESDAHLSPESLPLIMERLQQRGLRNVTMDTRQWGTVRVRFDVSGVVPGRYDFIFEGDSGRMEPSGNDAAQVSINCDTEAFVLLLYGRLSFPSAVAEGRITTVGDRDLVAAFGSNFQPSI